MCLLNTTHTYGRFLVTVDLLDADLNPAAVHASSCDLTGPTSDYRHSRMHADGLDVQLVTYGCVSGDRLTIKGRHFSPLRADNNISFVPVNNPPRAAYEIFAPVSMDRLASSEYYCTVVRATGHVDRVHCSYSPQARRHNAFYVQVRTDNLRSQNRIVQFHTEPTNVTVYTITGCRGQFSSEVTNAYGCVNGSVLHLTGWGFPRDTLHWLVHLQPVVCEARRSVVRADSFVELSEAECQVLIPSGNQGVGQFRLSSAVLRPGTALRTRYTTPAVRHMLSLIPSNGWLSTVCEQRLAGLSNCAAVGIVSLLW